jgi:hypothetical protein
MAAGVHSQRHGEPGVVCRTTYLVKRPVTLLSGRVTSDEDETARVGLPFGQGFSRSMAGECERGCALCGEDGDEMDEVCAVHVGGDTGGAGRVPLNVCFIGPPIGQGGDRVHVWTELGDQVTAQAGDGR